MLEQEIGEVWVEGEVSNHRKQASGHQYFTLKDPQAQLSCVFFRGHAMFNRTPIRDGAKLRLFGEMSLYEARGQYQLIVKQARTVGAGNLHERFEALKARLRQEGLFAEARKQAIPKFPARVGLITSPTGAVLRDLLSVLKRRAPWVEVLVYPARVQGDGAYLEIVEGLQTLGKRVDIDTIVLARGGGSLEDLWAFNEEAVARAIAACPIPTIAAVGHETDFSIADFVADLRAPTPSAAAELAAPDQRELRQFLVHRRQQLRQSVERRLDYLGDRLEWMRRDGALHRPHRYLEEMEQRLDDALTEMQQGMQWQCRERAQRLSQLQNSLRVLTPQNLMRRCEDRLDTMEARLRKAMEALLARQDDQLQALQRQLRGLGPEETLARGFSIVLDENRDVLQSVDKLPPGKAITLRMFDGEVGAKVDEPNP